jgi:hypothetical protein
VHKAALIAAASSNHALQLTAKHVFPNCCLATSVAGGGQNPYTELISASTAAINESSMVQQQPKKTLGIAEFSQRGDKQHNTTSFSISAHSLYNFFADSVADHRTYQSAPKNTESSRHRESLSSEFKEKQT